MKTLTSTEAKRVALPACVAARAEKASGDLSLTRFLGLAATALAASVISYVQEGSTSSDRSFRRSEITKALESSTARLSIDGVVAIPSLMDGGQATMSRSIPLDEESIELISIARAGLSWSQFLAIGAALGADAVLTYAATGSTDAEVAFRRDEAISALKHFQISQVRLVCDGGVR